MTKNIAQQCARLTLAQIYQLTKDKAFWTNLVETTNCGGDKPAGERLKVASWSMTSGQWSCHHPGRNTGTNMINCCCAKNWHIFRNLGRPRAPETIGASFNIWAA